MGASLKTRKYLGIDIGTTSLKAAVFDGEGKRLGLVCYDYTLDTDPSTGFIEFDAKKYVEMTKRAISDILSGSEPVSVTVDRILGVVSRKFGVSVEDMKGPVRSKNIAKARHIAIYLVRVITSLPLKTIGDIFGNRDHATIKASLEKVPNDMRLDKNLQETVQSLLSQLKST